MNDYLEILKKFSNDKDIAEVILDIVKLRNLYFTQQFDAMRQHIQEIYNKHIIEAKYWDLANPIQPITYQQSYINADNFLSIKGFCLFIEKGYKNI